MECGYGYVKEGGIKMGFMKRIDIARKEAGMDRSDRKDFENHYEDRRDYVDVDICPYREDEDNCPFLTDEQAECPEFGHYYCPHYKE